jgi:hypothetical protein
MKRSRVPLSANALPIAVLTQLSQLEPLNRLFLICESEKGESKQRAVIGKRL